MSSGSIQVNTGNTSIQQMSLNKDDVMDLLKDSLDKGEPFASEFASKVIRPLADKINQKISVSELRVDGSSIGELITKVLTERTEEALDDSADKYHKAIAKVSDKLIDGVERDSAKRAKSSMDINSILTGVSENDDVITKLKWMDLRWTVFKKAKDYTKSITFETNDATGNEVFDLHRLLGETPKSGYLMTKRWNTVRSNILDKVSDYVADISFKSSDAAVSIGDILGSTPQIDRRTNKRWRVLREQLLDQLTEFTETGLQFEPTTQASVSSILGESPEDAQDAKSVWSGIRSRMLDKISSFVDTNLEFDQDEKRLSIDSIIGDTPSGGVLFRARWSMLRHSLLTRLERQMKDVTLDTSTISMQSILGDDATKFKPSDGAAAESTGVMEILEKFKPSDGAAAESTGVMEILEEISGVTAVLGEFAQIGIDQKQKSVQERDPSVVISDIQPKAIESLHPLMDMLSGALGGMFGGLSSSLQDLDGMNASGGFGNMLASVLGGSLIFKKMGAVGTALIAAGPVIALVGGLVWAGLDAFRGWAKSDEWGTSKISGAVGGILGGLDSGVSGAFKNMGKWALVGAGIGSIFPVVGTLVGGLIGAAVGGVIGFIGGERIAGAIDSVSRWGFDLFMNWIDGWKSAFSWFSDISDNISKFVTSWFDPEVNKIQLLKDSVEGVFNFLRLTGGDILHWVDNTLSLLFGRGWDAVKDGITKMVDWFGSFFEGMLDRIKNLPIIGRLFNRVTDEEKAQRRQDRADRRKADKINRLERDIERFEQAASGDSWRAASARRRLNRAQEELMSIKGSDTTIAPKADDFIWRNGEPIQPFNSKDNLISVKDDKTFSALLNTLNAINGEHGLGDSTTSETNTDFTKLITEVRKMSALMEDLLTKTLNQSRTTQQSPEPQPLPAISVGDARDPAYKLRMQAWSKTPARPGGMI